MISAVCSRTRKLVSVLSNVKCLPATCVRAPYCTETESSQHKVKENRIREFLSSHSGGRVELDKDNSTGLATITINNPEIRNGFSDSEISPDLLKHEDYFNVKSLFTVQDLFDSRVHLGHKVGLRNPYMVPFLYGNRLGVDIIDLEQTSVHLERALNFVAHMVYQDAVILFVSKSRQSLLLVEETAKQCGEYSHCRYWRGGIFTNTPLMFNAITRLPDLCIFLNTHNSIFEQHVGIVEAAKINIPTIGIVDSSSDPRLITYPIPGNDDTPCAVQVYCSLFRQVILNAKQKRKEDKQKL